MNARGSSLLGAGIVTPWCCLAPMVLSLIGVSGLSLAVLARIEATLFPYLAILAAVLLGRAHYLLYARHQGNRISKVTTWMATGVAGLVVGIRLWGMGFS